MSIIGILENGFTANKLDLCMELNLMSHLDVMLPMDLANMHLVSLVNVPIVSVWSVIHPYVGFMGWGVATIQDGSGRYGFLSMFCFRSSILFAGELCLSMED